jgi:mRNA interferase RelE/StbE
MQNNANAGHGEEENRMNTGVWVVLAFHLVLKAILCCIIRLLEIHYTETAIADLERLPPRVAGQIMRKIDRLQHGLQGDIKRLTQFDCDYRLRSGDYRILFDVEGQSVIIQRILHRGVAYD